MPKKRTEPSTRFSLVLYGENFKFIQVMSRIKGTSGNQLINDILAEYMETHKDTYQKALRLMEEAGGADGR